LLRRVLVALLLVIPMTLVAAPPATAGTESEFVARANAARTSRGLRAYAVRSDLSAVARRHAARMAAARRMYHNPSLASEVRGWSALAENVGRGPSVESIHNAFMSSSSHRGNILSTTYTEIGVGTARASNGELFVSQVFRRPTGASTYVPAPRPVYRQPQRASRSAPRRLLPARRPPAKKRVVVDPTPGRLRAAWALYRKARPVEPFDRAVVYVRVNLLVAD
jgi:hypothetical protein